MRPKSHSFGSENEFLSFLVESKVITSSKFFVRYLWTFDLKTLKFQKKIESLGAQLEALKDKIEPLDFVKGGLNPFKEKKRNEIEFLKQEKTGKFNSFVGSGSTIRRSEDQLGVDETICDLTSNIDNEGLNEKLNKFKRMTEMDYVLKTMTLSKIGKHEFE